MFSSFYFAFVCLFLAMQGLHFSAWVFSSCSEWGATFPCRVRASHCGAFSHLRAQDLGMWASVGPWLQLRGSRALSQWLWQTGLFASWHMGSSQTGG